MTLLGVNGGNGRALLSYFYQEARFASGIFLKKTKVSSGPVRITNGSSAIEAKKHVFVSRKENRSLGGL